MRNWITGALCAGLLGLAAPAAVAQDEDANLRKSGERATEHQTPEYQAELQSRSIRNTQEAAAIQAGDPERNFPDVCFSQGRECAGDIRLYDFQERGRGLVTPVLWTARNGSTVSGRVWATKAGPAKRPGIVITNGSIQAPETLYWWAAQTLAKAGYVVVTFDPQQQGRSDTFGEGTDANEGLPSQTAGNTFYDWTQDAIDFLLSTPAAPFCARPSRSGTSHCDKQRRRVGEGRNAQFNPFWELVDAGRIGIAGHSYGAAGVSWIAQQDRRVDAVVAWDDLCDPALPPGSLGERGSNAPNCLVGGQGDPPGRRVPSLGITADYFTGTERDDAPPDPAAKSLASRAFSQAGVDTGEIAIRGGTHFEFSYLPSTTFRATLRGMDLVSWYTNAWFDKYVKGDGTADARLLTTRWRSDPGDRDIDPAGGGNLYSYKYRSRLDVRRADGTRFTCEDLRTGCAGQVEDDGEPARYSYLAIATSADGAGPVPGTGTSTTTRTCASRRAVVVHVRRVRGLRIRRVEAFVGGRRVGRSARRRIRVNLAGLPRGRQRVRLRITGRRGGRVVHLTQRRAFRTCTPRRRG